MNIILETFKFCNRVYGTILEVSILFNNKIYFLFYAKLNLMFSQHIKQTYKNCGIFAKELKITENMLK